MMDSSTGPHTYTNPYTVLFQQQNSQPLPPIHNLGLVPPAIPPATRDPSRRPRARSRPFAEPANFSFDGNRVRRYYIEDLPYEMEAPVNEDHNVTLRRTFDGRTLKYTLAVLQQPERARACGAGARCESLPLAITFPTCVY